MQREKTWSIWYNVHFFYHNLDDNYLQKELSDIPEEDQSLNKFHEVAVSVDN